MKLKDIGKYVEEKNKLNKFLNNEKTTQIEISGDFGNMIIANNITELIEKFTEQYYGNLNKDTELHNENGYITFFVRWTDYKGKDEREKYYLYITEKNGWNI